MDSNTILIAIGILLCSFSTFGSRSYVAEATNPTAKTIHGDLYDCIDKLIQPGLDNAATLDLVMKDRSYRQSVNIVFPDASKHQGFDLDKIWTERQCPPGMVPIPKRVRKNRKLLHLAKLLNQTLDYQGGTEFAGIVVNQDGLKGAYAEMALWHPDPVIPGQFSAASILIENGLDVLEAGWIVHPDLYHDTQTRLYTAWRNATGGSYNMDNPGFIVTSEEIPLNFVFLKTSDPRDYLEQMSIMIQIGATDGNWHLTVNNVELGYWEAGTVPNLAKPGTKFRFGGQVYSHPSTGDSPPMGSGSYKGDNPAKTSYMQHVKILVDEFKSPSSYQKWESRCYFTGSDGDSELYGINGFRFLFGGTGGHDQTTCIY